MSSAQLPLFEADRIATDLRQRARVPLHEPIASTVIARRVLGAKALRIVPRLGTPGVIARVAGEDRIFVNASVPDREFVVAHELGHWALRNVERSPIPDEEEMANLIGAALVAPRALVLKEYARVGENVAHLAKVFHGTKSMVVLRLGEVLKDERVLVTRSRVRVRSGGSFDWPDEGTLRTWAVGPTHPGVVRTKLRGGYDHGRIALRAS